MKFRLKGGVHFHCLPNPDPENQPTETVKLQGPVTSRPDPETGLTEVTYEGDVIETDQDLCVAYRNKFQRVSDDTPATFVVPHLRKENQKQGAPQTNTAVMENEVELDFIPDGWTDITENYELAQEKGLRVLKRGMKYNVTPTDDPHSNFNSKPLKLVELVPFLKRQAVN